MDHSQNWKFKTILIGTIIGAVCGAISAGLLVQQAEKNNAKPKLNAGDSVKIGMGILGVIRQIADLVHKE
jgi:hypothetical protein